MKLQSIGNLQRTNDIVEANRLMGCGYRLLEIKETTEGLYLLGLPRELMTTPEPTELKFSIDTEEFVKAVKKALSEMPIDFIEVEAVTEPKAKC